MSLFIHVLSSVSSGIDKLFIGNMLRMVQLVIFCTAPYIVAYVKQYEYEAWKTTNTVGCNNQIFSRYGFYFIVCQSWSTNLVSVHLTVEFQPQANLDRRDI